MKTLYQCTCRHCREVLENESPIDLAHSVWVHEARHPELSCPDLDEIYRRMTRAEPKREGVLLR